jgi:hypothetical protein
VVLVVGGGVYRLDLVVLKPPCTFVKTNKNIMDSVKHLRDIMRDNNLDYDQVKIGLKWEMYVLLGVLGGTISPTKPQQEAIENYIKDNGLDIIKVRKFNGIYQTYDPELSKILEDYYTNQKK